MRERRQRISPGSESLLRTRRPCSTIRLHTRFQTRIIRSESVNSPSELQAPVSFCPSFQPSARVLCASSARVKQLVTNETFMSKARNGMRAEYRREDLGKGVRGKYYGRVSRDQISFCWTRKSPRHSTLRKRSTKLCSVCLHFRS